MSSPQPFPPEFARSSPAALAVAGSRGRYLIAPHLAYLNRKLLDLAARRTRRLAVSWPPRHGKSELASVNFPAWWLGLFPSDSVLLASYEAGVASNFSSKARDVIRDVGESIFDRKVSLELNARDYWGLADERGTMRSAGVGGALTGFGAKLLICDDLLKNATEANSPLMRDRVDDWFRSVALTRLEPDACVVLIGTRWHQDDIIGRVTSRGLAGDDVPWDFVNLPALATDDEPDPLGRKEGEALWPARFSAATLERTKSEVGSYVFNALYQGRPSPGEGTVFRRNWFLRRYTNVLSIPPMKRAVMAVDGAWKQGAGNSRSAISLWATDGIDRYLLDAWAGRLGYSELKLKIADAYMKWATRLPNLIALVEEAASGLALLAELRIPVKGVLATDSKVARAERVTAALEGGRCVFPANAPWFDDWLDELLAFPYGANDDQVDAMVHALAYLQETAKRYAFGAVTA